jgi:peptidoglycan/xylan/chitin deacetylase (PgdA/CDA1 family)
MSAESQIFGKTLVAPSPVNEIALTYDDGPNPSATPQLLDLFAKHGVRATFFLIGNYARQQTALVREIAAAGHEIGDHSMTHPHLALCSARRVRDEIGGCKSTIEEILGRPVQLFRPPYGSRRPDVLRVARELGMTPVMWNIICQDWTAIDAAQIFSRADKGIQRNHRRGCASNIVLHDGSQTTSTAARLETVAATRTLLERYPAGEIRYRTVKEWLAPEVSR